MSDEWAPWDGPRPEPDREGGQFAVPYSTGHGGGYAQAALAAEVARVASAANGTRNHTLNRAAFSLGQLVAGGDLDRAAVERELTAAGRQVGLDDREIARTIASGLSGGSQHPRTVPPAHATILGNGAATSTNVDETAVRPAETDLVDQLRAMLVDSEGLDNIPEPESLIGDILFKDSIGWLIGPPGNGKSFVALDMSGCVATGQQWQGHDTNRGGVLYLVAEGLSGIRGRVRAWEASMGQQMVGLQFLPVAVQASSHPSWQAFISLCAQLDPSLIVVDTQARVTTGMEENSAKDMGQFVDRVEALRRATRACVLVVHHQGRSGDHMRGSTALEGAATTIIRVTKDDDLLSVECAKQKDAAPFDPFKLRLVSYADSAVVSLIEDETPVRLDTPTIRRMLAGWWSTHELDWVSVTTLVDSQVASKATFHRAKKALERAGDIESTGEGTNRRYRLRRKPIQESQLPP